MARGDPTDKPFCAEKVRAKYIGSAIQNSPSDLTEKRRRSKMPASAFLPAGRGGDTPKFGLFSGPSDTNDFLEHRRTLDAPDFEVFWT